MAREEFTYLDTLDTTYRRAAFQLVCRDEAFARVVIPRLPDGYFEGIESLTGGAKVGEWGWLYAKLKEVFLKSNYKLPKPKGFISYIISEAKRELGKTNEFDRGVVLRLLVSTLKMLLFEEPEIPFEVVRPHIEKGIQCHKLGEFLEFTISTLSLDDALDTTEFDKRYYDAVHGVKDDIPHTSYRERFKEAIFARDNLTRVPTGLTKLDSELLGGLACGELGLLAAETGAGKTTLFANWAAHALKNGHLVGYVTLETSGDNIMNMVSSFYSKIQRNALAISKGKAESRVEDALSKLPTGADLLIKDVGPGGIGAAGIRLWLQSLRMSGGSVPEVLFVDYLNNMDLGNKRDQKYVAYRDEMTALAGIAHDFGIALWVTTQFSKEGSRKRVPDLTDIAGSWDMLNVPPTILLFFHPEGEKDTGYRYLKVEKTKSGVGQPLFNLRVDFHTTTFEDTPIKLKAITSNKPVTPAYTGFEGDEDEENDE